MYDGRKGLHLQLFDIAGHFYKEYPSGIHENFHDMKAALESNMRRIILDEGVALISTVKSEDVPTHPAEGMPDREQDAEDENPQQEKITQEKQAAYARRPMQMKR